MHGRHLHPISEPGVDSIDNAFECSIPQSFCPGSCRASVVELVVLLYIRQLLHCTSIIIV
jgi:hypothetical protein